MALPFSAPPQEIRVRCDNLSKLVESACNDLLITPNWSLNMQIVDDINQETNPTVLTDVIRVLRKRLRAKSIKSVGMALTLSEALVKNCSREVHKEIASENFMDAMTKVVRVG
ncbi:unnamed protein product [Choristocarpus tenellus]